MENRQQVLLKTISSIDNFIQFFESNESLDRKSEIIELISSIKQKLPFYSLAQISKIYEYLSLFESRFINPQTEDATKHRLNPHHIEIELSQLNAFIFETSIIDDITPEKLITLVSLVKVSFLKRKLDFPDKTLEYLNSIFKSNIKLKLSTLEDIYSSFIAIYNSVEINDYGSKKDAIRLLKDTYIQIREISLDIQETDLIDTAEEIKSTTKIIKENLGLAENEKLISVFKHQSDQYNSTIQSYTHIIIFIFVVIASSILIKLLLNDPKISLSGLIIFGSYILSLSGLLTYLIKERSRLVSLQTYCIKCYLELSALPNYLADLTEEQAQNLKIELSKIYFRGHGVESEKTNISAEATNASDLLEKITKLITDIKNLPAR